MIADYPYLRPATAYAAKPMPDEAGVPAAMAQPTAMAPKISPPNAPPSNGQEPAAATATKAEEPARK